MYRRIFANIQLIRNILQSRGSSLTNGVTNVLQAWRRTLLSITELFSYRNVRKAIDRIRLLMNSYVFSIPGWKKTELFLPDEYYQKLDDNIAKTTAARDAEVDRIQSMSKTQQSKYVTVVGGVDLRKGEVFVGAKNSNLYKGNASCTEDLVFRGLGGNTNIIMTLAVRPRTGEIIPVCPRCQTKYPVNQFVEGTTFQ